MMVERGSLSLASTRQSLSTMMTYRGPPLEELTFLVNLSLLQGRKRSI